MPGCASMGDAPWRHETLRATVRGDGGRLTRWWVQLRALVAIGLLVLFAGMSIVLGARRRGEFRNAPNPPVI